MTRFFTLLLVAACANGLLAQDFSFGFKIGGSFNRIKGPLEKDDNAKESLDGNAGFHFGATFAWKATDLMGLRGELIYSQKGVKRSFEGSSYYKFINNDNVSILTKGIRKQDLNVNVTYLELPLLAYFKPHNRVEIYGGASLGLRVSAAAFGNIDFSVTEVEGSALPAPIDFNHELDFNYIGDKAGEYSLGNPAETIKLKGDNVPYPQTAGAYFEFAEDRGKLYKAFDLGVVGGLSVYLSRSLYISGRINYGLLDITKSKADVYLSKLDDNNQFIQRDDDDRNVSIQASVGFSF